MKLTQTQFKKWQTIVLECYPEEACAIVKTGKVIKVANIAEDKENSFEISPEDIIKHKPEAILHSHTYTLQDRTYIDRRTPSLADMNTQRAMDIPWGISETEGENCSDILWFPQDRNKELYGRRFIFNVDDCYTLLRDYYYQKLDIELPYYPENVDYNNIPDGAYFDNIKSYGFYEIPLSEAKEHDVLLLTIDGKHCCHSAIYLGNNKALNHFITGLSRDMDMGLLSSWLTTACRWEGFREA